MEFLTDVVSKTNNYQKSLTTILQCTCIALIFMYIIKFYWERRFLYYYSWNVPGPKSLPFMGCAYLLVSKKRNIVNIFEYIQDTYPDIGAGWFGPNLFYVISKPEYVEKILTSPKSINKGHAFDFWSNIFGAGLFTAKNPMWKKQRRAIMPAFNQKILDYFQTIFAEKSEIFVKVLQKEIGNKNLDMFEYITNCTLDIICQTALGLNMDCQYRETKLGKNLDRIMDIITTRACSVISHLFEFTWPLYEASVEFDREMKQYNDFNSKIIKKRLEAFEKEGTRTSSDYPMEEVTYKLKNGKIAFLDLVIENTNFTEEQILDETKTFIAAGTDTTASSLCYLFVILGLFPDVQQKVLEEILDIVGPDRTVLPSDLPHMKYIERVIKETLRIFPLGFILFREAQEDIDAGDIVFPAGAALVIGALHLHRNPKYWPDPMKFDPDRFLPENVAKRHPCTYLSFSYGPRNCIGARYGIMNLKTMLATTIRKFKIFTHYKSLEEIELDVHMILRLKDGPKVWVEAR